MVALNNPMVKGILIGVGVSALGFCAVWLLNMTTAVTGMSLGLNLFNALTIGVLGVPGLGLLLLLKWVLA